jgi:hypothetical protein
LAGAYSVGPIQANRGRLRQFSALKHRPRKAWAGRSAGKYPTESIDLDRDFLSTALSTDTPKVEPSGITLVDSREIANGRITERDAMNSHAAIWGK